MTLEQFKNTLAQSAPPLHVNDTLKALWYDAKGNWDQAHDIAQEINTSSGAWIHAYLHRKEGDTGNAWYWYHRANRPMPRTSLDDEWLELVQAFLTDQSTCGS